MDDFAHIVGEDVHFRGRSPPGERGLKFKARQAAATEINRSLPTRGAWIEIREWEKRAKDNKASLPTRGAWIEINPRMPAWRPSMVAPHPGSVD